MGKFSTQMHNESQIVKFKTTYLNNCENTKSIIHSVIVSQIADNDRRN